MPPHKVLHGQTNCDIGSGIATREFYSFVRPSTYGALRATASSFASSNRGYDVSICTQSTLKTYSTKLKNNAVFVCRDNMFSAHVQCSSHAIMLKYQELVVSDTGSHKLLVALLPRRCQKGLHKYSFGGHQGYS